MWTSVGQVILQLHAAGKSFHASVFPDDFNHLLLQAEKDSERKRGRKRELMGIEMQQKLKENYNKVCNNNCSPMGEENKAAHVFERQLYARTTTNYIIWPIRATIATINKHFAENYYVSFHSQ